ncbi:hypothetical protein NLU66_00665 [Brachybacterium sp. NBEC-018]|uniref:hypothetical protein n=1 Tax=Brachybacterium sp. NBEC-018 TaxID=2996004 RepID=UPI002174FF55|nr:hypothetical protein [Brachybacterium sp. NBEC-018]UVY84140.1 hypothetical protein NLU66_00665 [Brachybacterium sp. NBEC-018]
MTQPQPGLPEPRPGFHGPQFGAPVPAPDRRERRDGARYGMALVATVIGSYLLAQWSPVGFVGFDDPLLRLQGIGQLGIGLLVLAGGLALAPTALWRAALAVLVVVVPVLLGTVLVIPYLRGDLDMPQPFPRMLDLSILGPAVGLLGWLIVRGRSPVTYVLVLGFLLILPAQWAVMFYGIPSPVLWGVELVLAAVIGIGAAWLAALGSRWLLGTVRR